MPGLAAETLPESGYTVSAVARRLGVAAATLRTWDRRYGISPSLRTTGAHRRYTQADLLLLERMQALMMSGMAPGDAARAARAGHDGGGEPAVESRADNRNGTARKAIAQQRGLARAAASMDARGISVIIRTSIERNGVAWTWDEVIAPVVRLVGDKCEASDAHAAGVDVEHHLSYVVIRELVRTSDVDAPVNTRPVLLAAAPEEQHTLPLFALAAALAERSVMTRLLGGRTPDVAMAAAVRRTGPLAVFIWAHARPDTDLECAVPAIRPMPVVVVGGPGWQAYDLPPSVSYAQDLNEAIRTICAAVRPSGA